MKRTYELTILNQKFTIKSDDDEKYVKKVADYVNRKMHDIVVGNQAVSTANVAVLTALNIADDLLKTRQQTKEQASQWAGRVGALIRKLEGI